MCHAESCARSVPSASFAMHENMPFLRLIRTFRDCERFVDGPDAALSAPAPATAVRPAQKRKDSHSEYGTSGGRAFHALVIVIRRTCFPELL